MMPKYNTGAARDKRAAGVSGEPGDDMQRSEKRNGARCVRSKSPRAKRGTTAGRTDTALPVDA